MVGRPMLRAAAQAADGQAPGGQAALKDLTIGAEAARLRTCAYMRLRWMRLSTAYGIGG